MSTCYTVETHEPIRIVDLVGVDGIRCDEDDANILVDAEGNHAHVDTKDGAIVGFARYGTNDVGFLEEALVDMGASVVSEHDA